MSGDMTRDELEARLKGEFLALFRNPEITSFKMGDWEFVMFKRDRLTDSSVEVYRDELFITRERLGRWKSFRGFLRSMVSLMVMLK